MSFLGLDIGGANIKTASIRKLDNKFKVNLYNQYLPIWKLGKEALERALKELSLKFGRLEGVGLTMTAEVSDVYWCKREGVNHVIETVEKCFREVEIKVVSVEGKLIDLEEGKSRYLKVASANWAATGWMVSKINKTCVVVDVGSTTTSIIPIVEGRLAAKGLNDLEKLMCGELIYTGALRTDVSAIVNLVPLRGGLVRVSSELFTTSGDVHLILGNIEEHEYKVDTADGRGVSRKETLARLARLICADLNMLEEGELVSLARFIYLKQLEAICEGLIQVYTRLKVEKGVEPPAYTAGIGANFLAEPALRLAGAKEVFKLSNYIGRASKMAPALGAGLMLLGEDVDLKSLEVVDS